eukprot:TRINITY_DN866_c0_g1_i2.p2 TRINITY_DN866_c0_g1~~TRINITY_DN866_c0_g1_i2.p2  ORF type:complete len:171 (-),score=13.69 TRINITY_DN866_c0_g1_i2:398-910(-)
MAQLTGSQDCLSDCRAKQVHSLLGHDSAVGSMDTSQPDRFSDLLREALVHSRLQGIKGVSKLVGIATVADQDAVDCYFNGQDCPAPYALVFEAPEGRPLSELLESWASSREWPFEERLEISMTIFFPDLFDSPQGALAQRLPSRAEPREHSLRRLHRKDHADRLLLVASL